MREWAENDANRVLQYYLGDALVTMPGDPLRKEFGWSRYSQSNFRLRNRLFAVLRCKAFLYAGEWQRSPPLNEPVFELM